MTPARLVEFTGQSLAGLVRADQRGKLYVRGQAIDMGAYVIDDTGFPSRRHRLPQCGPAVVED